MKKIYSLLLMMTLLVAHGMSAAIITQPDPAKKYMIQHSSGMFMTVSGNKVVIQVAGEGDSQKVTCAPVEGQEGVYTIQFDNGKYLGTDKSWTSLLMDDPTDHMTWFQFRQSYLEDWGTLYNVGHSEVASGGNDYFGTDNNSANGGVYTNKGGNDGKHLWILVEATDGLIMTALDTAIANAEATLGNASVGSTPGSYPQEAVDALNAAIATAQQAYNATTQAAVNEAAATLDGAVAEFNTKLIAFLPKEGQRYYLVNTACDLLMGINGTNEAALQAPAAEPSQQFEIVSVDGSLLVFNLKIADGSGYLARKGAWNTTVLTDPTVKETKIEFEIRDLANNIYSLKKFGEWGYMATDSEDEGSLVYTDKSNSYWTAQWQIVEVVEGKLILNALEHAIASAESYLAKAVVGEEPGNYPQEAVDALTAAVATAKSALTAATQAEVNEAAAALKVAINEFLAAKIDPFFTPRANTAYRFSVRKYASKYMTMTDGVVGTSEYAAGNTDQHWTFQPVADAKHTFIVKNGNKVLNYDGTTTETADADAPRWTVVYTTTVSNVPYFALVQYDDPTKVVTFGSGSNFAIQSLNTGNDAHQARLLRVDAANDPNLAALEQAVANARYTLENIDRGNEIGQWSDAKCDAFEAVINEADALTGATQEEVDAKVTALNEARTEFVNNPNSVIKDELDAAIAAGRAKLEGAKVGIHVGDYLASDIEGFKTTLDELEAAGATVSEQDDCDALTAQVLEATEAFKAHTEEQEVYVVLYDLDLVCYALFEAEQDNVGDDQGQRPQEVIDAFEQACLDAMMKIYNGAVSEADIQDLLDAREAFLAGAISENRTDLRAAIAKAEGEAYQNIVPGEFDGNYAQEAVDNFNTALENARSTESDKTKTQDEIDAATKALNDAMNTLDKSKVTINFAALDAAVAAANTVLAGVTEIGDAEGQCPTATVDAFKAAIAEATGIERAAISQADVDAATAKLAEATATFKNDVIESTGINAAILKANGMLDEAVVGFKPGNYPSSAVEALREAMNKAIEAAQNTDSTQADLLAALAALNQAMADFGTQAVAPHDLTEINALIEEAEAFIAETGSDDFALSIALESAKAIVENPNDYTKSEVTKATTELRKALDYAKETGIAGVNADALSVLVVGGKLAVELEGEFTVAVYTIDGRMVAMESARGSFELALGAGKYIVAVKAEGVAASRVVIVK